MLHTHFRMREPKIPAEKYRISVDFDQLVEAGDAVTAAVVKAFNLSSGADVSASVVDGSPTISEDAVEIRIQAGVATSDYAIEFAATTTAGDVFIRRVKVEVEE